MSEILCDHCAKPITGKRIVIPRLPEPQLWWAAPKDTDPLPSHKELDVDNYHLRCRPELAAAYELLERDA